MKRTVSRQFQRGDRDANEKDITAVLRAAGAMYKLLPTGFGADILLITAPMAFVEVKNGEHAKLTEVEKIMKLHCEEYGIDFYIIRTPEEAAEMLGKRLAEKAEAGC